MWSIRDKLEKSQSYRNYKNRIDAIENYDISYISSLNIIWIYKKKLITPLFQGQLKRENYMT